MVAVGLLAVPCTVSLVTETELKDGDVSNVGGYVCFCGLFLLRWRRRLRRLRRLGRGDRGEGRDGDGEGVMRPEG